MIPFMVIIIVPIIITVLMFVIMNFMLGKEYKQREPIVCKEGEFVKLLITGKSGQVIRIYYDVDEKAYDYYIRDTHNLILKCRKYEFELTD